MDSKRVEEIYDMLQSMKIVLVSETTQITSSYLTDILAKCDDYVQKTDDVLTEVLRDIVSLERRISDQNDVYDAMLQETLQRDPEVKAHGTGSERTSAAKFKLRDQWKATKGLEADLRDAQTLQKVIDGKRKRLGSAIVSVKKQWDSNVDAAKYLNLSPRDLTDDAIYTARNHPTELFADPALTQIIEESVDIGVYPEEKKPTKGETSIIEKETSTGEDSVDDLLTSI